MVSFGALLVVFLQLRCLFTAYANIMSVCTTNSDKMNQLSPFQNFMWQTEVLFAM